MENSLIITENAFRRVKELISLEKKPVKGLRISVEAGGCSGFKYRYELTNETEPTDIIMENAGTKIFIDEMSAPFIQNAKLDFIEDLGGAYFSVSNPNASSKCGCGSSFGV